MRYEHLELDLSTAACAELFNLLEPHVWGPAIAKTPCRTATELRNLTNELRARLQRRDADPHSPLNLPTDEELLA